MQDSVPSHYEWFAQASVSECKRRVSCLDKTLYDPCSYQLIAVLVPPSCAVLPAGRLKPVCPGVPLVWPSSDFALDYVWHIHSLEYSNIARWRICAYNETRDTWQIRARDCDCSHPDPERPCVQCIRVQIDVQNKHTSVMHAALTTNYHSQSWRTLANGLRYEQAATRDLNFRVCDFPCRYSSILPMHLQLMKMTQLHNFAAGRVGKFEEIMKILSTYNIPRLSNLLSTTQRQNLSLSAIAERLLLQVSGTYRSTGHYTDREHDFALLSLRLGGYRMLHALSREHGLPTRATVQAAHVNIEVEPCIVEPDDETIIQNIRQVVLKPRQTQPKLEYSFIFSLDETALDSMIAYYPRLKALAGICTLCHPLTLADISNKTVPEMLDLADKVRGTETVPAIYHLANQATVVCVVFQGANDHRALPILVSPCCSRKDAPRFVQLIDQINRCWAMSGAEALFGKPMGWSTDGDPSRRKGGFSALKVREISPDDPILGVITLLDGMDQKTGPYGETLDIDTKHGFKRTSGISCSIAVRC
jgi:hypothetical protein